MSMPFDMAVITYLMMVVRTQPTFNIGILACKCRCALYFCLYIHYNMLVGGNLRTRWCTHADASKMPTMTYYWVITMLSRCFQDIRLCQAHAKYCHASFLAYAGLLPAHSISQPSSIYDMKAATSDDVLIILLWLFTSLHNARLIIEIILL